MMSAKPARKNFGNPARLCLTLLKWLALQVLAFALLCLLLVIVFRFIPPPYGLYMKSQSHKLGAIKRDWQPLDSFARHVPLSVIAAEDADFCSHYGFDIDSIKTAWDGGKHRGASHPIPTGRQKRLPLARAHMAAQRVRGRIYRPDRNILGQKADFGGLS